VTSQFKDFAPEDKTPALAFTGKYESAQDLLERINEWAARSEATILNVETVVLPGSASGESLGTSFGADDGIAIMSSRTQVFRVWHKWMRPDKSITPKPLRSSTRFRRSPVPASGR
jgi:hypothetical protein